MADVSYYNVLRVSFYVKSCRTCENHVRSGSVGRIREVKSLKRRFHIRIGQNQGLIRFHRQRRPDQADAGQDRTHLSVRLVRVHWVIQHPNRGLLRTYSDRDIFGVPSEGQAKSPKGLLRIIKGPKKGVIWNWCGLGNTPLLEFYIDPQNLHGLHQRNNQSTFNCSRFQRVQRKVSLQFLHTFVKNSPDH